MESWELDINKVSKYWNILHNKNGERNTNHLNRFCDFPIVIAEHLTHAIYNRHYVFDTDNTELLKFWNTFKVNAQWDKFLSKLIFQTSLYGEAILGFDKIENSIEDDQGFRVYLNRPKFIIWQQKSFEEIVSISTFAEKETHTVIPIIIRETWTHDGRIKRTYIYNSKEIALGELSAMIPNYYFKPQNDRNPFYKEIKGRKIPIIPFEHFTTFFHTSQTPRPDWLKCTNVIKDIVNFYDWIEKERLNNRTIMYVGNLDPDTLEDWDKRTKNNMPLPRAVLVSELPAEDQAIQAIHPNINWESLQKTMLEKFHLLYSLIGISLNSKLEANVAEDIKNVSAAEIKTIISKRMMFNQLINRFLKKMFYCAGFGDVNFSFAIRDGNNKNTIEYINAEIAKLNNGLQDRITTISNVQEIGRASSVEMKKLVDKDADENRKQFLDFEKEKGENEIMNDAQNGKLKKFNQVSNFNSRDTNPKSHAQMRTSNDGLGGNKTDAGSK